jgi:hypothetical protein
MENRPRLPFGKMMFVVLVIAAGIGLGIYKNRLNSTHLVEVKIPNASEVSIYKDLGGDGSSNYSGGKLLFKLVTSQKVKLADGTYDFVVTNNPELYQNPVDKVVINSSVKEVLVTPVLTDQALANLLKDEVAAANAALFDKFPTLKQSYTLSSGRLYLDGNWYGAVLKPQNSSLDSLKIIEHKQNDKWVVAVSTPAVSIGQPSNPSIPFDVLKAVDQL